MSTGDPVLDGLLANLDVASVTLGAAVKAAAPTDPGIAAALPASVAATAALAAYTVPSSPPPPPPPPPPGPAVTTTVVGTTVTFNLTGIPTSVKNVSITEGAKKIADVPPTGFPKLITTTVGTHTYTLTGWPTLPGGGGSPVFTLTAKATV